MADDTLARKETTDLIASDKVEGTAVYNRAGEKLGSIHNFMVDKRTGKAQYAVLSFGGMLGMGKDYYPLPWETLTYDTRQNGYCVDIDKETLKSGPHYAESDEPTYDPAYGRSIHSHYGVEAPPPV
jgi:hypothetical protein